MPTATPSKPRLPVLFALVFYLMIVARTAWLTDDALITLRTVRNLLNGFGPVWNIDERVQTYTHPLWMLLLTSAIAITGEYFYTVLLVSILVALLATGLLLFRHASGGVAALLALVLLSFSKAYGDYSTSGLENPLTHLLLVIFYLLYFREAVTSTTLRLAAFIAALGMLNRIDSGLIFLPPLLYLAWRGRSWPALGAIAVGFLPLLAWELFSVFYYGFPFPNTAYAKLNTAIDPTQTVYQGWLYLLRCLTSDPMTGLALVAALALALVDKQWKARWLGAGILLYLLYVVRIGGDYTLGRFLSAPLLCAVVYLARQPLASWSNAAQWSTIGVALLVGLMPYNQSALFVSGTIPADGMDNKGIADERKMFLSLSLLESARFNRFYESGLGQGWNDPIPFKAGAIGRIGFAASSYTHVVDEIGLGDPLLARLPARYDPVWRAGHPVRVLPDGYLLSHRAGKNLLTDPALARYYDKLKLIISGDLWDQQRLLEIWRFNRGAYDSWIDVDRYRFPDRLAVPAATIARTITATVTLTQPVSFGADGLLLEFATTQHAEILEIGADLDRFALVYFYEQERLAEQVITQTPIRLDTLIYQVIHVPPAVAARGYTRIHFYPQINQGRQHEAYPEELSHSSYTLTFFDPVTLSQTGPPLHPEQLAELYYFEYFQGKPPTRPARLTALLAQLQQVDAAGWGQVAFGKLRHLAQFSDPLAGELFRSHLPTQATLTDPSGRPLLRYLGSAPPLVERQAQQSGLQFNLHFEVLGQFDQAYSLWFHIVSTDSDEQWMIYDYFPAESTATWPRGAYYEVPALLRVEPGNYEISFGFWTAGRQRLYADAKNDIHWINLGKHAMPTPPEKGE